MGLSPWVDVYLGVGGGDLNILLSIIIILLKVYQVEVCNVVACIALTLIDDYTVILPNCV